MAQYFVLSSHGVQTVAETPGPGSFENVSGIGWTDVAGLRQGWGVTYRGRARVGCWFHSPIPSLQLPALGQAYAKLGELALNFDAQGTARVTSVHLWSGNQRIKTYDGLNLAGVQTFRQLYYPELDLPGTGLNVCAAVAFGTSASNVVFMGAYGRFVTP